MRTFIDTFCPPSCRVLAPVNFPLLQERFHSMLGCISHELVVGFLFGFLWKEARTQLQHLWRCLRQN